MSSSRYYSRDVTSSHGASHYKTSSPSYSKKQFDSGFSDTFISMPMQVEADSATYVSSVPPPRPNLMVDAENGDSGINMGEDDTEKDCPCTTFRGQSKTQIPDPVVPMEVDGYGELKSTSIIPSRSSSRSPISVRGKRSGVPRIPKRTGPSSIAPSASDIMRTVSAPLRPTSPRSESRSPRTYSAPFTNKENRGPVSLPAVRSSSPLTCNNYQSLSVLDRVPPMGTVVPLDIHQLREYMGYFLPDTKDGDTGFHLSVIHNQPDVLDKLLFIMSKEKKLKPVLDEQNTLYQTALHLATHLQQVETMRKLLIAGASINITDHKGNTPLHIAAKFSSTRPLEEIIRYISIQTILEVSKVRNNEGLSCIHIAAKNGNMEILQKLRSLGVDIDMQDFNSGKTALHLAVENNSLANVQFLLETCEADVNSLTYSGCSPLHIASGRGDIAIVAYLVSMGADPELCTDEGDVASELSGSEQVLSFLKKADALRWL